MNRVSKAKGPEDFFRKTLLPMKNNLFNQWFDFAHHPSNHPERSRRTSQSPFLARAGNGFSFIEPKNLKNIFIINKERSSCHD